MHNMSDQRERVSGTCVGVGVQENAVWYSDAHMYMEPHLIGSTFLQWDDPIWLKWRLSRGMLKNEMSNYYMWNLRVAHTFFCNRDKLLCQLLQNLRCYDTKSQKARVFEGMCCILRYIRA